MVTYTETWNIAFKTSNLSEKYKNIKSTYSIPQDLIISFYSKYIPMFNELVIKNTLLLLK